jgi:hypothetical protein
MPSLLVKTEFITDPITAPITELITDPITAAITDFITFSTYNARK